MPVSWVFSFSLKYFYKNNDIYIYIYWEEDIIFINQQQPNRWITPKRCGRTSSIHNKKLVTWIACLARLWATEFLSWQTWENLIRWKDFVKILASCIKRPKEAKEGVTTFKELITNSESPSRTAESMPSSRAKSKALTAAMSSTSAIEWGRAIFWESKAITKPRWSLEPNTNNDCVWFGVGQSNTQLRSNDKEIMAMT